MARKAKVLDPEKGFENPVRKEPSSPESEATQESLPGVEQVDSAPEASVSGNKCVAHFVRLRPDQNEGERELHFEFALQLSKEVAAILPPIFLDAWETLSNDTAIKRLDLTTEEEMDWGIYLAPDDKEPATLSAIVPHRVRVQSVEETGSTKARQVVRLSFSLAVPLGFVLGRWALAHYGDLVWLQVAETNARLPFKKAVAG